MSGYTGKRVPVTVNNKYNSIERSGIRDSYLIAFLEGICYTENCYECPYARFERVGDITIGDSWGSEQDAQEIKKGVSLILCQTQKGIDLINECHLELLEVDIEKAKEYNHQLVHPSEKKPQRDVFIKMFNSALPINKIIKKIYPQKYYRQNLKKILLDLHILRGV